MEPCASIMLYSIGALGAKNRSHAKALGDFFEKELGMSADRYNIYLLFGWFISLRKLAHAKYREIF